MNAGDDWPVFEVIYSNVRTGKVLLKSKDEGDYTTRYDHVAGNHTLWYAEQSYQIDYLIFAGASPADLMHRLPIREASVLR